VFGFESFTWVTATLEGTEVAQMICKSQFEREVNDFAQFATKPQIVVERFENFNIETINKAVKC
jgi:hypothetical protein